MRRMVYQMKVSKRLKVGKERLQDLEKLIKSMRMSLICQDSRTNLDLKVRVRKIRQLKLLIQLTLQILVRSHQNQKIKRE